MASTSKDNVPGNQDSEPLWSTRLTDEKKKSPSPEDLARAEQESAGSESAAPSDAATAESRSLSARGTSPGQGGEHENQVGSGYNRKKAASKARLSRRKKLIGVGTGILGAGAVGLLMFFVSTLRLEGYLNNINQRVFGIASSAVSQRVEHLFEVYMITHVLTLESCGPRVTNACKAEYKGISGNLFNAWRDARVEQKLIDKYDLKFETHKNPEPGQPRITIRNGTTNEVINLTEGQVTRGEFTGGSRQFGNEINKFLKDETRWYEVMQRKSVRKYLVRKHDVKFWCFFACNAKDDLERKKYDAKTRLKYKLTERTIYPFSGKLGFIMDCLVSGEPGAGRCSAEELRKRGIDRDTLSDDEIKAIVNQLKDAPNSRLSQVLIEKLYEKIMQKTANKAAISAIPFAGQVYLALLVVDMLDQMDGFVANHGLSKFAADLNSRQYLEYYIAMRSANDEMKKGVSSANEVGALMNDFDGAEESLVYQQYNTPKKSVASIFGGNVYAAEKDPYRCANGKPIPKGERVCEEKKVAKTFAVEDFRNDELVDGLSNILNQYRCGPRVPFVDCNPVAPKVVIHRALKLIDKLADTILGPVVDISLDALKLTAKPFGGDKLMSFVEGKTQQILTAFLGKIFPLPVQVADPGREKYDGLEGGARVAASEFGKGGYTESGQGYGLGGKLLNSDERTAILQDYSEQQKYAYSSSSLLTKLTSLEYQDSIANRFIAAAPTSFGQFTQQFIALMSNPFKNLFSSPVSAATSPSTKDPFGIDSNGYSINDPAFTADPNKLTEEYCKKAKEKWEDSKTENKITGFEEYSTTNPCLLEEVVTDAASSVFTGDDTIDGSSPPSAAPVLGDGNMKDTITVSTAGKFITMPSKYSCPGRTTKIDSRIAASLAYLITKYNLCVDDGLANGHRSHGAGLGVDIRPRDGNSKQIWKETVEAAARDMGWWGDSADEQKSNKGCAKYSGYGQCVGGAGKIPQWVRWLGYNGDVDHGDPWHIFGGSYAHIHIGWNTPNGDGVASSIISEPRSEVYTFPASLPSDLENLIN